MAIWRIPYSTHAGLVARAAPGTHEAVATMIRRCPIAPDAAVLDLAAGTGALLSRIRSLGFNDLTAVELDLAQFGLTGVKPQAIDLNTAFATKITRRFRLVTAVEIIEHLDSPRAFLGELLGLLEPGGYAIISTPNLAHWLSRLRFLATGVPKFFTEQDIHEQRHISPILDHHMRFMLSEIGFDLKEVETTASSWGPLLRLLTWPLSVWFRLLKGPNPDGNVNIYLVRKKG